MNLSKDASTICKICDCSINHKQLFCIDVNHIKIHHDICCPTDSQLANTNRNDVYEQLPLKLKIANHLHIATELIEKSENTDTLKIRWLENIANVLKGIENEWEMIN